MKHWILACSLALLPVAAQANVASDFVPTLDQLDALPLNVTSAVAVSKALTQAQTSKHEALLYAATVPLGLSLADGVWDSPQAGMARWRTRLYSSGAQSLALDFSQLKLPSNAALWLYDTQGQLVQGPYTAAMVSAQGRLFTAMVPAETIVVELRVPSLEKNQLSLHLNSVDHGYRSISKSGLTGADAGSCNIDVACTQGDSYRDEIRSVAAYTVRVTGGSAVCTGQLVNNMRQDSTPYFLTANHCNVREGNADSVVVYWNFQRASCNGSANGSLSQNQTGATFLARDDKSDFTLIRLSQAPSSSFNVYYQGWDVSDTAPGSGAAIHHPQGDVKKISLYGSGTVAEDNACAATSGTGSCIFRVDGWRVQWAQGTTEGGSSGSGLLNQNKRIIGVLSGGGASCENPTAPDYFGRLAKAWQASCSSGAGQLKAWLDPDASGRTELCGQNPGTPCNTAARTSGGSIGVVSATGACAATTPTPRTNSDEGGGALGSSLLLSFALPLLWRRRKAATPARP